MHGELTRIEYGKSRIRMTKVDRDSEGSRVRELGVALTLHGEFDAAYRDGDNSKLIATDSMKNIVMVLAQSEPLGSPEVFGRRIGAHFLDAYPHVEGVDVELEDVDWQPLHTPIGSSPEVLTRAGDRVWTARVEMRRDEPPRVSAGVRHVALLRTTGSSFAGYIRDEFTTLEETDSRVVAIDLEATWRHTARGAAERPGPAWDALRRRVLETLIEAFARHESRSLQHTLHAMGQAALAKCAEIDKIRLRLENRHLVAFDASPFGVDVAPEDLGRLYTPLDEPSGLISGELARVS